MIYTMPEVKKMQNFYASLAFSGELIENLGDAIVEYEVIRQFTEEFRGFKIDERDVEVVRHPDYSFYADYFVAAWRPKSDVAELLGGRGHGTIMQLQKGQNHILVPVLERVSPRSYQQDFDPREEFTHNTLTYEVYGWSTDRRWIFVEQR